MYESMIMYGAAGEFNDRSRFLTVLDQPTLLLISCINYAFPLTLVEQFVQLLGALEPLTSVP